MNDQNEKYLNMSVRKLFWKKETANEIKFLRYVDMANVAEWRLSTRSVTRIRLRYEK